MEQIIQKLEDMLDRARMERSKIYEAQAELRVKLARHEGEIGSLQDAISVVKEQESKRIIPRPA